VGIPLVSAEAVSPFEVLDVPERKLSQVAVFSEVQEARHAPGTPVAVEVEADILALGLMGTDEESPWGVYVGPTLTMGEAEFPARAEMRAEHVQIWKSRAESAKHPYVRQAYAFVVWELGQLITKQRPEIRFAHLAVDSLVQALDAQLFEHPWEAQAVALRMLSLARRIRDTERARQVEYAIVRYERATGLDDYAGTWGHSIELLMDAKCALSDEEQRAVVADMEARLARLVAEIPRDPLRVEEASLALARYFQRKKRTDDAHRVVRHYADAYTGAASSAPPLMAHAWLEEVQRKLESFGMRSEAAALVPALREYGQKAVEALVPLEVRVPVQRAEIDAFLAGILSGTEEEIVRNLAWRFVPRADVVQKELQERARDLPLTSMLNVTLVDARDGRPTRTIGSVTEDLAGRVAYEVGQLMSLLGPWLALALKHAKERKLLSAETIMELVNRNPLFRPDQREIVRIGLEHAMRGEHVSAAHVLVPQVEAALRELAILNGADPYARARDGSRQWKLLDELLRLPEVEAALTSDVVLYLRVLLTDMRGWNLRNSLSHGLRATSDFSSATTDRLVHSLLLLCRVQEVEAPTATGP
jgi:hypothetical protein